MITFHHGNARFNYRVVAVLLRDDKVLLQTAGNIDFWVLPGGRCELGESAQEAIVREMLEELGEEIRVERVLWVLESFFDYERESWHEISFLFLASLPPGSPVYAREEFVGHEPPDTTIMFRWFALDELQSIKLYPLFLPTALKELPETTQYVIIRENLEP